MKYLARLCDRAAIAVLLSAVLCAPAASQVTINDIDSDGNFDERFKPTITWLKTLTSPSYNLVSFVGGEIMVTPKVAETAKKNLLFATFGLGGKGLLAVNVSKPRSFVSSDLLWEYSPAKSPTAAVDADLGQMLGKPVYAKMNDGKAAVILGNGYNSTDGKAVLYIFLLATNGSIASVIKLDTLASGDNGLATPGVFDADGNGTVDYIYAGDLQGNVWKFDVNDKDATKWPVGSTLLFVAKDKLNNLQPITAPITIAVDDVVGDTHRGKRFIFFGTGACFRTTDPADTAIQSWYGLIDDSLPIASRSALKESSFKDFGTVDGKPVRAFSAATPGDMVNKAGWYLDFKSQPGERIITKSSLFKLAVPSLVASSILPNPTGSCASGGSGYINVISPFNGGAVPIGILDVNNNRNYLDDLVSGSVIGSVDMGIGMPSEAVLVGRILTVVGTSNNSRPSSIAVNLDSRYKGRISWREIIQD